ncbi:MAG TPA: DUF6056 family protein [Thermoanaerobaculia bacterium]|nr:DUF6056 family protein [Thermoanaerobaculia bacterium]
MSRPLRLGLAVLTVAVLAALATYAWRGRFARYVTDDFCTSSILRDEGFFGMMRYHRVSWSGRYSFYPMKAIPESIGPGTARVMPALMIALFGVAAIWTMRRVTDRRCVLLAVLTGTSIAYAAIDATPEVLTIGGPLMWETGTVTYMLPLILYTIWAGLFFGPGSLLGRTIASALVMFLAGGLSETSLAAQCALTGAMTLLTLGFRWREASRIALAGCAASIVALLLVVSAPGNVVRMRRLPPRAPFVSAALSSARMAYDYVGSVAFSDGKSLLLILLCGAIAGATLPRFNTAVAIAAAIAAACGYGATFLPSAWMLSMGPPPRALHVCNFFLMAILLPLSALASARKPRAVLAAAPVLLVLLTVVPIASVRFVIGTFPKARADAAELDRIDALMRANRGKRVVVHSPWSIAERVLVEEPEFWTNRCMSQFYGVHSIRVTR